MWSRGAKPANTPLEQNQKLTSVKYDEAVSQEKGLKDPILQDPGRYQRLLG